MLLWGAADWHMPADCELHSTGSYSYWHTGSLLCLSVLIFVSSCVPLFLQCKAGTLGGLLQDFLVTYLPEEEQKKHRMPPSIPTNAQQQKDLEDKAAERRHQPRHTDATAAVIAQLQTSLDRKQPQRRPD